jgi:hypothetical protein
MPAAASGCVFRSSHTHTSTTAEPDWQETPELMAELNRRLAEFQTNPDMAVPFEPEYFESVKRQLADECAQMNPNARVQGGCAPPHPDRTVPKTVFACIRGIGYISRYG